MNDDPLSPLPKRPPEPEPVGTDPQDTYHRLGFWPSFGLGILLFIVSCVLCVAFQGITPFGIGFLAAIASLFFRGYRGIFVGFITVIGLVLLVIAVICGSGPARF